MKKEKILILLTLPSNLSYLPFPPTYLTYPSLQLHPDHVAHGTLSNSLNVWLSSIQRVFTTQPCTLDLISLFFSCSLQSPTYKLCSSFLLMIPTQSYIQAILFLSSHVPYIVLHTSYTLPFFACSLHSPTYNLYSSFLPVLLMFYIHTYLNTQSYIQYVRFFSSFSSHVPYIVLYTSCTLPFFSCYLHSPTYKLYSSFLLMFPTQSDMQSVLFLFFSCSLHSPIYKLCSSFLLMFPITYRHINNPYTSILPLLHLLP